MLRAQAGDREAFDELLTAIRGDLQRYVSSLMRGEGEADDVVQEIFLTVVRRIRTLRDAALFRPWLFRIASREVFRTLRADREWKKMIRDDYDLAASPDLAAIPDTFDPAAMLSKLSIASRAVIAMRYLEDLKQEEIATALGISVGTVKSRIAYGLMQLRKAAVT